MILRIVLLGDERKLAGHVGLVWIGFGDAESRDAIEDLAAPVVGDDGVVGDVEVAVVFEIGMKRKPEQAKLGIVRELVSFGQQIRAQIHEEGFFRAAIFPVEIGHDFNRAGFAANEDSIFFAGRVGDAQRLHEMQGLAAGNGESVFGGVADGNGELWRKGKRFHHRAIVGSCGFIGALKALHNDDDSHGGDEQGWNQPLGLMHTGLRFWKTHFGKLAPPLVQWSVPIPAKGR